MNVIGISGYARCGKDTFVGIAKGILSKNGYIPMRTAFADILKEEIEIMLQTNGFDLDVYTDNLEEKSKIRPLMVFWGCARRDLSKDGLYWVHKVDKHLQSIVYDYANNGESTDSIVTLVSDVRFPNEAKWIQESWDGEVIHLRRYTKGLDYIGAGEERSFHPHYKTIYDPAPNEEEEKQDPIVMAMANHRIEWENIGKLSAAEAGENPYLRGEVLKALNATKFFNGKLVL